MDDVEVQSKILEKLTEFGSLWSNKLFRKVGGNKERFTLIRDEMIEAGWISGVKKGRNLLLTITNFEASKFDEEDWTKITRINCTNWLKYFKDSKPIFNKKKKIRTKNLKVYLDAYFRELDRQMIVCTRLVNAEALGLILSSRSRKHQKKCVEFVHEFIKKLLNEHKEFKEEIKEYAQSQLRTVQFKI